MNTYSLYDLSTGVFTGQRYTGQHLTLHLERKPGTAAVAGQFDPHTKCVDLRSGAVIDYKPARPSDSEFYTWKWDEGAQRWKSAPSALTLARLARAERDAKLASCDWVVARAVEAAEAVPHAWREYRAALRDISEQAGFPTVVVWPIAPQG